MFAHSSISDGPTMYVDENRDGDIDSDESVIRREGSADGITVSGNPPVANYVSYTALGHARLLSSALQMGTFVVCKPGQDALKVVLANSGRARIDKTRDRCV
jgi:type IV fimbrial biogenesis protein FimT